MIKITRWHNKDCTIGRLELNGFQCFTLELPDIGNVQDISCIPIGNYEYYFRESPSNGPVLELRDVPKRRYIQLHAGNFTSQIQGCILIGDGVRWINRDSIPDVSNSKATLKKLIKLAGTSGTIEIR